MQYVTGNVHRAPLVAHHYTCTRHTQVICKTKLPCIQNLGEGIQYTLHTMLTDMILWNEKHATDLHGMVRMIFQIC
jgi:hypothetical protein